MTAFGLWVYILSDCILFASLFAAYAVLYTETGGRAGPMELFDRPYVLVETLVLLTSSFTCGLAVIAAARRNALGTWLGLTATFLLGAAFIGMELHEFGQLIAEGHGPSASAFLSAFFALVGTHGLHVFAGLLWILTLALHLLVRGATEATARRVMLFSLFWHFLDIVWIFLFSFVYLFSAL
jgi:cytochrome o ubiquinol oxidase subunit 3